jgi:hypothetical protein
MLGWGSIPQHSPNFKQSIMRLIILLALLASCEFEPYNAFQMDYESHQQGNVVDAGTIVPVKLFRTDEIADSIYSLCICDSVTYTTKATHY